jgi:surfactin synthase thioesterase subunit
MHRCEVRLPASTARLTGLGKFNLLLLPYAGAGGQIYRDWRAALPSWINPILVDLPGHGRRYSEQALCHWTSLIDILSGEILPHLDRPFGIFGHSMGALVALELAHVVRWRYQKTLSWFCASGCVAPSRRTSELKWLDCSGAEIIEELRELGGTSPDVLDNRELLELMVPVLRADFHLCGSYLPPQRPPLPSTFLVRGGTDDELSHPLSNLSDWSDETSAAFRLEMIDGGHFFVDTNRDSVIRVVVDDLTNMVQAHV